MRSFRYVAFLFVAVSAVLIRGSTAIADGRSEPKVTGEIWFTNLLLGDFPAYAQFDARQEAGSGAAKGIFFYSDTRGWFRVQIAGMWAMESSGRYAGLGGEVVESGHPNFPAGSWLYVLAHDAGPPGKIAPSEIGDEIALVRTDESGFWFAVATRALPASPLPVAAGNVTVHLK